MTATPVSVRAHLRAAPGSGTMPLTGRLRPTRPAGLAFSPVAYLGELLRADDELDGLVSRELPAAEQMVRLAAVADDLTAPEPLRRVADRRLDDAARTVAIEQRADLIDEARRDPKLIADALTALADHHDVPSERVRALLDLLRSDAADKTEED